MVDLCACRGEPAAFEVDVVRACAPCGVGSGGGEGEGDEVAVVEGRAAGLEGEPCWEAGCARVGGERLRGSAGSFVSVSSSEVEHAFLGVGISNSSMKFGGFAAHRRKIRTDKIKRAIMRKKYSTMV